MTMIAILLMPEDFQTRDIYIDYPFEHAKFRWDKDTEKVYRRFYGKDEVQIPWSSDLFREAVSAGKEISRDEYNSD